MHKLDSSLTGLAACSQVADCQDRCCPLKFEGSAMMQLPLCPITREELDTRFNVRPGETHLGQTVQCMESNTYTAETLREELKERAQNGTRVALLGVSEDIGPRANAGRPGAFGAFAAGLSFFLNMQSNRCEAARQESSDHRSLSGREVVVVGLVDASAIQNRCEGADLEQLRAATEELDSLVHAVARPVLESGLQIAFVGGGHNNALPLMRATAEVFGAVRTSNLDPHADARSTLEGRHSGNGFSSAWEEGHMSHYAIVGLHQRYNSEAIEILLEEKQQQGLALVLPFEDWLDAPDPWAAQLQSLEQVQRFLDSPGSSDAPKAIELDLDAIACMPSSAWTPSGVSLEFARTYVRRLAKDPLVKYLDLAEGAPALDTENGYRHVGKAIACLLADFVQVCSRVGLVGQGGSD